MQRLNIWLTILGLGLMTPTVYVAELRAQQPDVISLARSDETVKSFINTRIRARAEFERGILNLDTMTDLIRGGVATNSPLGLLGLERYADALTQTESPIDAEIFIAQLKLAFADTLNDFYPLYIERVARAIVGNPFVSDRTKLHQLDLLLEVARVESVPVENASEFQAVQAQSQKLLQEMIVLVTNSPHRAKDIHGAPSIFSSNCSSVVTSALSRGAK